MKLYSIFLPKNYNNKKPIQTKKIRRITKEIREKFGSYSADPHAKLPIIEGTWTSETKKLFNETMTAVQVFTEDTYKTQRWFKAKKETWAQELDQEVLFIIEQHAEIL